MPTFASLFTGGGLADVGAIAAGFDLAWGIEINPDIAAIASKNLNHIDKIYTASVIGFDWSTLLKVDHLHLSPPCQDFSVAKTTGNVVNQNNELAEACIQAINTLMPSSLTLENVEGYRKSKAFYRIVDALWGNGYWVDFQVLNSADFGVPQTRRRLFLRAALGRFLNPLPPKEDWNGWYDAIADLIPGLPDSRLANWQVTKIPERIIQTCLIEASQNRQATLRNVDEPSFTVLASSAKTVTKAMLIPGSNSSSFSLRSGDCPTRTIESTDRTGNIPKALASGRIVRMTPRALARLQTIPDWYKLPKKALACKIIGNGVPCLMMQKILESI